MNGIGLFIKESTPLTLLGKLIAFWISSLLILLPSIACNLIYYVFFRDILNLFNEDKKANVSTAIIVCVIDAILLCGLARTCYFYTLMKKQPLPVKEVVMDENVVTEFVTVSENLNIKTLTYQNMMK